MPKNLENQNNQQYAEAITLASELQFLIACCQAEPNIEEISRYMQKMTNGEAIIALAFRHGILPLVYQTLKNIQPDILNTIQNPDTESESGMTDTQHHSGLDTKLSIDREILSQMKTHCLHIAKKNMLMAAELIRIKRMATQEDIAILPFKGPVLAQIAYKDISMRQFSDLDILIHRKDFRILAQKMLDKGYTPLYPIETFHGDKVMFEMNNDCPFYDRRRGLAVEMHWDFFRKLALPTQKFFPWENRQTVSINGFSFETLCHESHLVYHSLHGSKHVWERLLWITDIDRFIRAVPSLDWDKMLKMSKDMGAQKMFLLGIALAERYFHTPLPKKIHTLCKTSGLEPFFVYVESEFNSDDPLPEDSLSKLAKVIGLRDTLYHKTLTLLEFLFRPGINERRTVILSDRWFWLYWPLRPIGMAWRFLFCRLMKLCTYEPVQNT